MHLKKSSKEQAGIRLAFIKSLPILCSYLFVSMAYGMMMSENGFSWPYSLFISLSVYTGAFQFVLITFLSSGASFLTVAVTAFLMNSRQTFYSLNFLEDFKRMGKRKFYMIYTMTDETYAVNCTLGEMEEEQKQTVMYWTARFCRAFWMSGTMLGAVAGQILPQIEGIDFCMTALFITIFIDQWEKTKNHVPALLGTSVGIVCLILFGTDAFILPSLLITSGILVFLQTKETKGVSS